MSAGPRDRAEASESNRVTERGSDRKQETDGLIGRSTDIPRTFQGFSSEGGAAIAGCGERKGPDLTWVCKSSLCRETEEEDAV